MRMRRIKAVAMAAAGTGLVSLTALTALPQTSSAAPAPGQSGPAAYGHRLSDAPSASPVEFSLVLNLRDPAGAAALVKSISDPTSSSYRHYETAKQWEAQFSPGVSAVNQAQSWLKAQGFSVGAIPADRITVPASGTVAQVEKAFGTSLGEYSVNGHTVREADGQVVVPSAIASVAGGVMGINEIAAHKNDEVIIHCRSGARSQKAALALKAAGFTKVSNLTGGILAWAEKIDPTMPKY